LQRRLVGLDLFIHEGVGEHGFIPLVVTEATVAEDVDDHVAVEFHPELGRDLGRVDHGLGIVGGVLHRVREQADRPHRGLQLVGDVGDEVAADLLHALLPGAVLDQREHQPGAQRRDAGGDVARGHPRSRHQQLGLPDLPVPAYLADHVGEVGRDELAAPHQPQRVRRSRRLEDLVVVVHDHGAGPQHRQHGAHPVRDDRLGVRRDRALLAVADVPRQDRAAGDDGADEGCEGSLERRVHGGSVRTSFTGGSAPDADVGNVHPAFMATPRMVTRLS
jgi:hypothetical protein